MVTGFNHKQRKPIRFGGAHYGMSDIKPEFMGEGYMKTLRNLFFKDGLRSRYGWTTIANGLTASTYTHTWDSTTVDVGFQTGFIRNSTAKMIVFEKKYLFDTDASSEDFNGGTWVDIDSGQEFRGCFEFASVFYVFSYEKVYSVNMSTGAKTAYFDWSTDVGASYDHVIQMFDRFGKIWGVSDTNSKVFWADDEGVGTSDGSSRTAYIDPLNLDWQLLWDGPIAASPVVQWLGGRVASIIPIKTPDECDVIAGQSYLFVKKAAYDFLTITTPDEISVSEEGNPSVSIVNTVASVALRTTNLSQNALAGQTSVLLDYDTTFESRSWRPGDLVTLSSSTYSEDLTVQQVVTEVGGVRVHFQWPNAAGVTGFSNTYTTNRKITSRDTYKVVFTNTWGSSITNALLLFGIWTTLVENTDYLVNTDPFEDDEEMQTGHIKLLVPYSARKMKCTYTEDINRWLEDNAGYYNIAKNQGTIVQAAEGQTGLYIFKQNPGAIYLLEGEPGPDATPGTLQLKLIHKGLTAKFGTIQTTMNGIYFGVAEQGKLELYFLPFVNVEVMKVPKLSEHFNPDLTYIGNASYTYTYRSAMVHGDIYLLTATYQASGVGAPSNSVKAYLCQAYYEENQWKGRWVYWDEDQYEEYLVDNPTHTVPGRAKTIGYYSFGDHFYRVYIVKDDAGTYEYNYHIARYCQADGSETARDQVYMLVNNGAVSSNATYDSGFYIDIRPRALNLPGADKWTIRAIHYEIEVTEGTAVITFYKDLSNTALLTVTVTGLETDDGSEQILRKRKINITCEYIEVLLRFSGVHSASAEEHLLYKDLWLEYVDIAAPGQATIVAGD